MAEGAVATTVPSAWTIHEGKLYLNFSDAVRDYWRKDIPGNVAAADSHWPEALNASRRSPAEAVEGSRGAECDRPGPGRGAGFPAVRLRAPQVMEKSGQRKVRPEKA